jgi:hypothetical protein
MYVLELKCICEPSDHGMTYCETLQTSSSRNRSHKHYPSSWEYPASGNLASFHLKQSPWLGQPSPVKYSRTCATSSSFPGQKLVSDDKNFRYKTYKDLPANCFNVLRGIPLLNQLVQLSAGIHLV